ncbi:hypothetical protein UFOVP191_16 [uncultured Caudovirales phage]|uniref:Uncharacterized protein n=1 Tax=uncultured Caudovirales phage TaxID=2100421 RepID=A0A6J7WFL1_9CAUD|nr:hypothetical protein UFOVP191_16 [uncultured Caudovirales phage]
MTPISITTYPEGEYTVLELRWYDQRLRKPQYVRAGMDVSKVLKLIEELQELIK